MSRAFPYIIDVSHSMEFLHSLYFPKILLLNTRMVNKLINFYAIFLYIASFLSYAVSPASRAILYLLLHLHPHIPSHFRHVLFPSLLGTFMVSSSFLLPNVVNFG